MTIDDVRSVAEVPDSALLDVIPTQRQAEPDITEEHDRLTVGPDARPLRVLAVGINFGPEHTGIAPYTTQLCEYLAGRGASVTVFTGVPHYPSWTVDPGCRWRLRRTERRKNLEIRRLRHHVPRRQSAVRRGLYEVTFAINVAMQRPKERPDVVLAVVPSLLGAVAAQRLAERIDVPLVVWVQDLMGQAAAQSGIDGGARVARLVGRIEQHVLGRAQTVVVLNQHFADHVRSIGVAPDRIRIRPNWCHVSAPTCPDRASTRARLGWRADETIVLHTGNMGLKQDLENVISAGRLADERRTSPVRFVLMGDGSQRKHLEGLAADVESVQFLPPAPTSDYANILDAADILLVNERPSARDMCLPSKLTSYFCASRPIVAATSAGGGTAAELVRAGAGLVIEPGRPDLLLEAVTTLGTDRKSVELMQHMALQYARQNLSATGSFAEWRKTFVAICDGESQRSRRAQTDGWAKRN